MIPGYNHNVKYRESVYHVQTEDSGIGNPHIITHLYVGGNIIESRKTSYADIVGSVGLNEMLVDLMQDQHKAMLKDLIGGRLDQRITERSGGAATLDGPAPLNVDAGAQHRASLLAPSTGAPAEPETPAAPPPTPEPAAPLPEHAPQPSIFGEPEPATSFFGTAPPAEKIIEAETLQRAFESKNENAVDSIFGEDLISEKSLDEVILSYLAEDMQKE
jgi:hypothetical protein